MGDHWPLLRYLSASMGGPIALQGRSDSPLEGQKYEKCTNHDITLVSGSLILKLWPYQNNCCKTPQGDMGWAFVAFATIREHVHMPTQHQMHIGCVCFILFKFVHSTCVALNLFFSETIFKNYMTKLKSLKRQIRSLQERQNRSSRSEVMNSQRRKSKFTSGKMDQNAPLKNGK